MNLKKSTRLFQQRVDWKNPGSRIRSIMDRFGNTSAAVVSSFQMRKGPKQQRRSSAGIGRDNSDSLSGLMVEWNVDAPSSWLWNDNQRGAAMDDSKLLTRLLQKNNFLSDEDDYLAEGKKVLPVEALTSAYKKFVNSDNSFVVQTTSYKGGEKATNSELKRANPRPGGFLRNQPALTSSCCPSPSTSTGRTGLISSKVPALAESRSWSRMRTGLR
jgi:hypothetical protein